MNPIDARAGGLHILRWQRFAVAYYGFTLAALALEPSDFCNGGVDTFFEWHTLKAKRRGKDNESKSGLYGTIFVCFVSAWFDAGHRICR